MSDISETVSEAIESARGSRINTVVALSVAVTATFTALCNVKDGNIVQTMDQEQAQAVDAWAYYQAKGTKQNVAQSALDQLQLQRELSPNLTPEARAIIDKKVSEYGEKIKLYESEKAAIGRTAQEH